MSQAKKILFVVNVPEREMKSIERIVSALKEINKTILTDFIEYSSPNFISEVLEASPDIVVTFPFTSIGVSQQFYIIKYLLNCFVITFPTEGILNTTSESNISRQIGFDQYDQYLVDHALFWGTKTAEVIGNGLLNTGKISLSNRIHVMGAPFFEAYFDDHKKKNQTISPEIKTKIKRFSRKHIYLFLTGFSYADYSDDDLIKAGDLINTLDQKITEKHFDEVYLFREKIKIQRSLWLEAIKSCAYMHTDSLFLVKIHPHETTVHRNKNIKPYNVLKNYDNIIIVEGGSYFEEIIQHCGLMFHYGSTAMLEAYLSKVPSVYLFSNKFLDDKSAPYYELEQLSTIVADIKDVASIVANHNVLPIKFQKNTDLEQYLYDTLDIVQDKNYCPSKKIAQFLLSLKNEKPQIISPDNKYLIHAIKQIGRTVISKLIGTAKVKIKDQQYEVGLNAFLNKAINLSNLGKFKINEIRYLRSFCLSKIASNTEAYRYFKKDSNTLSNDQETIKQIYKIETFSEKKDTNKSIKFNGCLKSVSSNKAERLSWENIVVLKKIKLYAGDIPDMEEYHGLIGLSITKNDRRHILHDITKSFPISNNLVDSFQVEDVFEHIAYEKLLPIVNEIYRILKPNGFFRISLPDYSCDLLEKRSFKDKSGRIIFDPGGGGIPSEPGHLWFPKIDLVKNILEKSKFNSCGAIEYLHYYQLDGTSVVKQIDYSKGYVQRTPDFDQRVQNPYRPMSMVIDLFKTDFELNTIIEKKKTDNSVKHSSQFENYYSENQEYFNWQKEVGIFGGRANLFKFEEYIQSHFSVIDFGCGGGYLLKELNCKNKIGIEVNSHANKVAQNNGIQLVHRIKDIPDNFADVIISNHALEHVENPVEILKDLQKKLKRSGKIVCVVPHQDISEKYNPDDINHHLYSWNRQTIGNLFKHAGFKKISIDLIQHQWPPNYTQLYEEKGEKIFHQICRQYAIRNQNYQIRVVAEKS